MLSPGRPARNRWRHGNPAPSRPQAALPPDAAVLAAGFASAAGLLSAGLLSAGLVSPPLSDDGLSSPPARLRFLSPSFLKSVSYQPLPASRNDGAVTRRRTFGCPHSGHLSGSGSDSFCRRSNTWLQSVHSNS